MTTDLDLPDLPAADAPLRPQFFRGRRGIVEPVCVRLRQPELLSSQIVGGPFSGKTSLLRFLASPFADAALGSAASALRVYVDANGLGPQATPAQFWMLACRELRSAASDWAPMAAGTSLRAALDNVLSRAQAGQLDLFDLQDLFDGCAGAGRPVVLLVDEFDTAIANPRFLPPAEFFNQIRNLNNRQPRGLAFVAGTTRPLSDVAAAAAGPSPPYNHFATIGMDPLDEGDIADHLHAWSQGCRVTLAPTLAALVTRLSNGQPLLAGALMRRAFEAAKTGQALDEAQALALLADPDGPVTRLNESLQTALSARERQAIATFINDPDSLTEAQTALLQRLRKFALLPPGLSL